MPQLAVCCITDVCTAHTWGKVDTNVNDKLYMCKGVRQPITSYMTTWTNDLFVTHPGNYDEAGFTSALNLVIHALDLYKTVSTHSSIVCQSL